jgi:uncharacterized membrane protein YjjB (DUF3815 family)
VGVLGGGPGASGIAFASNLLISLLARQLGRWRTPDFFNTAACSFVVTLIALLMWRFGSPLGIQIAPAIVVVGGILLLLPTGRLVSSVQDAINGFPVTAAGRFLSTVLTFGALVAGIAVAFVVGDMTGMEPINVTETFPPAYPWWALVIMVAVAVVAIGITEQTDWKLLLPTAAVGVIGHLVLIGGEMLGVGQRFSPAVAAVVIGLLARVVALRMGAPQLVVAVPAALILLPGLTIFRSMYVLTIEESEILLGAGGMLSAGAIVFGVAGGIVLGDTLARPLTRSLASNERRRARRR